MCITNQTMGLLSLFVEEGSSLFYFKSRIVKDDVLRYLYPNYFFDTTFSATVADIGFQRTASR